jgi:hypothetical protein
MNFKNENYTKNNLDSSLLNPTRKLLDLFNQSNTQMLYRVIILLDPIRTTLYGLSFDFSQFEL